MGLEDSQGFIYVGLVIMKVKIILWRDSRMYIEQCGKEDLFDICEIVSVGNVISEDEKKIVLAGDLVDEDVRRVIVIPKENIISERILK